MDPIGRKPNRLGHVSRWHREDRHPRRFRGALAVSMAFAVSMALCLFAAMPLSAASVSERSQTIRRRRVNSR